MTPSVRIRLAIAHVYGGRVPLTFAKGKITSVTEGKIFTPADLREKMGLKHGPDPTTYSTGPEQNFFLNHASKGMINTVSKHANAATDPETYRIEKEAELAGGPPAQKFNTVIPTTNTIEQVARFGEPARGEYQKTFNTVVDLFGHHPLGVAAWVGINAGLSPNAAYPDHAAAATYLTAHWLGLPKHLQRDKRTILDLVEQAAVYGKHDDDFVRNNPGLGREDVDRSKGAGGYTMGFKGTVASKSNAERVVKILQNLENIKAAMEHPEESEAGKWLGILSGSGPKAGMLKVPNFFASYYNQLYGTAIDTHMNRLLIHPFLSTKAQLASPQIMRHLSKFFPEEQASRIKALIKSKEPVKSGLLRELMDIANSPDPRLNSLKIPSGKYLRERGPEGKLDGPVIGGRYDEKGKLIPGTGQKALEALPAAFKKFNGKLSGNPAYYAAYKHALADAAQKLQWAPSEVQEAVWTGLVALMAANGLHRDYGVPLDVGQGLLSRETIRQGWSNNGAFWWPGLVNAYARAGSNPDAVARAEALATGAAAAQSRPGIVMGSLAPGLRAVAAHLPGGASSGDAGSPIYQALLGHLRDMGLMEKRKGKWVYKNSRLGEKIRLARYDAPLPLSGALQRVTASNQDTFIHHLRSVLAQSGVVPHEIRPAVHDVAGAARVGVFASGTFKNPNAPGTAAAWTGLLGRNPEMLSFRANSSGPDSMYKFGHGDADMIQQALQSVGVTSRVLVPEGKNFTVYVYDKGRQQRDKIASALGQLQVPADEWRGQGSPIGGNQDDMGREQYRHQINTVESGGVVQ